MFVVFVLVPGNGCHAKQHPDVMITGQDTHPCTQLDQVMNGCQQLQRTRALVETVTTNNKSGFGALLGEFEILRFRAGFLDPAGSHQRFGKGLGIGM